MIAFNRSKAVLAKLQIYFATTQDMLSIQGAASSYKGQYVQLKENNLLKI
jgi:hypothetical protein